MHVEGVDFNASYDFDLGDYGAWNAGITGTYYLHNFLQTVTGGPVIDQLNQNIQPAGGNITEWRRNNSETGVSGASRLEQWTVQRDRDS